MNYEMYMKMALDEAYAAFDAKETPIGCVIIDGEGSVIGRGRNMVAEKGNALCHAEIIAINQASEHIKDWRAQCAQAQFCNPAYQGWFLGPKTPRQGLAAQ
jgi:tRNA(adenine34) deaminase